MNPDDYEFDSYEKEFDFDRFNIDNYDNDYSEEYSFESSGFGLDGSYNPLAEF
jgi:hypothetical protein